MQPPERGEIVTASPSVSNQAADYELRFKSFSDEERTLAFPCDASGHVDMDGLSEKARQEYLYVRAVVGREFSMPVVQLVRKT